MKLRKYKIKTIKGVLIQVKKILNKYPNDYHIFTCNTITDACGLTGQYNLEKALKLVSKELMDETLEYFQSQRPTEDLHPEFFNQPLYYKIKEDNGRMSTVWWMTPNDTYVDQEFKICNVERYKFISKLITQL